MPYILTGTIVNISCMCTPFRSRYARSMRRFLDGPVPFQVPLLDWCRQQAVLLLPLLLRRL